MTASPPRTETVARIETAAGIETVAGIEAVVVGRRAAADDVVELTLAAADGGPLPPWQPGAHIDLHLGQRSAGGSAGGAAGGAADGSPSGLTRQYSLCGDPADRDRWRIAVLRETAGRGGSAHLHDEIGDGARLSVSEPRNNFELITAARYVFIAGGIGITPLLPMIAQAEAAGAEWSLLYGGRTRRSMAFVDDLANVGDIRSEGVEAEVDWEVLDGLTLEANGSYNDAYYTRYPNAPAPAGEPASVVTQNLTGKPVFQAPKWIFNATARYEWSWRNDINPYIQAQYSYRSSAFGDVQDSPGSLIPAYSLINARLGARFGEGGRYDASVWVENAANTVYFNTLGVSSITGAGQYGFGGELGPPRTFGATIRARF